MALHEAGRAELIVGRILRHLDTSSEIRSIIVGLGILARSEKVMYFFKLVLTAVLKSIMGLQINRYVLKFEILPKCMCIISRCCIIVGLVVDIFVALILDSFHYGFA